MDYMMDYRVVIYGVTLNPSVLYITVWVTLLLILK